MTEKILEFLGKVMYSWVNKVPKDKLAHFFASSVLLFVLLVFLNPILAYTLVLASVVFKDFVWDGLMKRGNFDLIDVVYGVAPILIDIINKL